MPVILLIVAEDSEVLFQSLVCTFGLTITFRVLTRDCHRLLYPARYSRRVQQGTGTGWVYPTLAIPVPPAGGWRVGGGSAHSNSARKACQRSTQTTPEASFGPIICRYVFLFIYYFLTNHAGSRRPTMANKGYIFLIISYFLTNHAGSQRPTTAGQRRSTKAHSSQQRPTKANAGP